MSSRLRSPQRGFTLIELLIVVAIIGIIAALLIPNFLDALSKAKQKRTVADVRNVMTAAMSRVTDMVAASAAGAVATNEVKPTAYGNLMRAHDVEPLLVPQYMQEVPVLDGWKQDYEYRLNSDFSVRTLVLIGSTGEGGNGYLGQSYTPGAFDPTDYAQDIVAADGFFIRWPQKVKT